MLNKIQLYSADFLKPCLYLFQTNTPSFFAISEEKLFQNYLARRAINYYIFFDHRNTLVACGGYEYEIESKQIALTWGMVDSRLHNSGYGTLLTEYRIEKINTEHPQTDIILNTTQHTFKFYEQFGFQVEKITKNYYRKGLHRYDMMKIIPLCIISIN